MTLFSMFFGDLLLLKENHLFYEKIWFYTKSHFFSNSLLISMFWLKTILYTFFSLKLYKVSIFNLFGRINTFCRKQPFHVTIYFFYLKFHTLRFFQFLRVLTAFYIKPPFTSITYAIWIINFSTFLRVLQYFYVKSIFPYKIKVYFYIQKWVFQ